MPRPPLLAAIGVAVAVGLETGRPTGWFLFTCLGLDSFDSNLLCLTISYVFAGTLAAVRVVPDIFPAWVGLGRFPGHHSSLGGAVLSTVGRVAFRPAVLLPAVAVRLVLPICASLATSCKSAAIPLAAPTALAVAVILCMSGTAFARAAINELLTRLLVFRPR